MNKYKNFLLFDSVVMVTPPFEFMMPRLGNRSIVASWNIIVPEGEFLIEFEHGTTSGKRVLWINGIVSRLIGWKRISRFTDVCILNGMFPQEHLRKDWMFRLVGPEHFRIGRFECTLSIEPDGTFGLLYSLLVNGTPVEQFLEANKKRWVTWTVGFSNGNQHNILFGRNEVLNFHFLFLMLD